MEKLKPEATNPWLLRKLKDKGFIDSGGKPQSPRQLLELIVETDVDFTAEVAEKIRTMGIEVHTERVSWGRYVPIVAPVEAMPMMQAVPHVRKIHYSMPRYPYFPPFSLEKEDPLIGTIKISKVEVPFDPIEIAVSALTSLPFWGPMGILAGLSRTDVEMWPTSKTRKIMEAPEDNTIITKVAVLDTGSLLLFHPMRRGRYVEEYSTIPGEPPQDGLGHGVHVLTTAFMGRFPTRFGDLTSVADAMNVLAVKVLSNFGWGSTESVLKGMEMAYKWGAKVVNMSLGGPMQGGVGEDPECRIINETGDDVIWVVAAGNEGPEEYTIGSPAGAPKALTVGAYSPKYEGAAVFSSRGPNSSYYRENPEAWSRDHSKYGENLVKPDILAPGGGPVEEEQTPVDLIYSGVQGWTDGMYDLSPGDAFEGMRGTSMAAPHTAGLVALLYERKVVRTATDVKRRMRDVSGGAKSTSRGYGLLRYTYW